MSISKYRPKKRDRCPIGYVKDTEMFKDVTKKRRIYGKVILNRNTVNLSPSTVEKSESKFRGATFYSGLKLKERME